MTQKAWTLGTFPFLERSAGTPDARCRVVIDNDFAGDPDDLFQVAHHVLSPSCEVRGIIASHLRPGDVFYPGPDSAAAAERRLLELFGVMGLDAAGAVWRGAEEALTDRNTPKDSAAARALVAEAMRDDPRPLFVCVGGGLTELASALILEPRIAQRITVVWIGGPEYFDQAEPPDAQNPEYNLAIDVVAGRVVFDSDVTLWQVPRNMYRQCLVSDIELRRRVAGLGPTGEYLYESLAQVASAAWERGAGLAETYALGDQPLVLLTALQSMFEADPSSSDSIVVPRPQLDEHGRAVSRPQGAPVRVFTRLDTRLMFEDMFLKLEALERWQGS